MFVNFVGSTEILERLGDDGTGEAVHILNAYFSAVHDTVEKYGGLLVGCDLNAVGDKLLIVFGAPVAHEDDDDLAVRCALDLQKGLVTSGLPFRHRIGINSGFVFCGDVGSSFRKEYTVMGDHVNLAARLMGVASEGQILVSQSVYSKARARFLFEAQSPVQVKGKSQPVQVYALTASKEDAPRRRISATELVGRDQELALIHETAESAFSGQGRVLSISGPAGVGKSRLAGELEKWWQSRGGLVLKGNCQTYGTNIPYLPWIAMLKSLFHLSDDDSNQERGAKVESTVSRLCPDLSDWTPLVGNLLGASIPESQELQLLDPKLRHQRLLNMLRELLLAEADSSRLLLLVDDAHWIDTASAELLDYVARNAGHRPVLICIVQRPDTILQLKSKELDIFVEIVLGELDDSLAVNLVRSITGMSAVPEELRRLVVERARGNPLFVEEVVGSLMDTGELRQNATTGDYELSHGLNDVDVPDTVQGIIMARLDRLGEETRNVLRSASVVGSSFQYSVVRDVLGDSVSEVDLKDDLDRLDLPEHDP